MEEEREPHRRADRPEPGARACDARHAHCGDAREAGHLDARLAVAVLERQRAGGRAHGHDRDRHDALRPERAREPPARERGEEREERPLRPPCRLGAPRRVRRHPARQRVVEREIAGERLLGERLRVLDRRERRMPQAGIARVQRPIRVPPLERAERERQPERDERQRAPAPWDRARHRARPGRDEEHERREPWHDERGGGEIAA